MTISFEGTYTKDEVFAMVKLSRRPIAKARTGDPQAGQGATTVPVYLIFAFASCVVGIITFGLGDFRVLSFLFGAVVVLGLMFFYFEEIGPRQAWKNQNANAFNLKGIATDEGVEIEWTSQLVTSRYQWEAFKGYGQHESTLVLFMRNGSYVGLPRSHFRNDKEWAAFQKKATQKLPVTHRVIVPTAREAAGKIAKVIILIAGIAGLAYLVLRP
jgi:hypothetical protein